MSDIPTIDSLTNTTLLNLLTPERQKELLNMLLKTKSYWIVIRESADFSGILTIHTSLDEAADSCCKDVVNKNKTCGYPYKYILRILKSERSWITSYHRFNDYDWTIYEFPVDKMKTNNVLN